VENDPSAAAVAEVWRREAARVVAGLTRLTHDLDLAEDLAQDALVAALEQWPRDGTPDNPGSWLMTVAKRRAVDQFRRAGSLTRKTAELGRNLEEAAVPDVAAWVDHIEDDVLRLVFLTCHPALAPDARAALTLRLVGGLTTQEIARGFLVKDTAVGQRVSRAKRTLTEVGAEFEMPAGREREARLTDVTAVVYLIFNEGYTATAGPAWARPELCFEAIRLARLLAGLLPRHAEVHGLQALLELQASRLPARVAPDGAAVLLEDQDRGLWDELLVDRGLAALGRAGRLGGPSGPYVLQAEIAACHARARTAGDTDWRRIAQLYDRLEQVTPSPVVTVNRAVAHGRAHGPEAGLAVLEPLHGHPALVRSHLLPAVRGDLLARAGRREEAAVALRAAAALTRNGAERAVLLRRAAELS
jgi:RNA polymerase sigma factor (sigma-70 family)